ncbi:MAG: hypothetical protein EHM37_10910 [Deltaproteobacteria bacterium]|nr:MAG: hypothetical protein EHM37_10910 [Deltaproteobacteria bacterium]
MARNKKVQWQGFIRRAKLANAPEDFEDATAVVRMFLEPVAVSLFERRAFRSIWNAPGPWR